MGNDTQTGWVPDASATAPGWVPDVSISRNPDDWRTTPTPAAASATTAAKPKGFFSTVGQDLSSQLAPLNPFSSTKPQNININQAAQDAYDERIKAGHSLPYAVGATALEYGGGFNVHGMENSSGPAETLGHVAAGVLPWLASAGVEHSPEVMDAISDATKATKAGIGRGLRSPGVYLENGEATKGALKPAVDIGAKLLGGAGGFLIGREFGGEGGLAGAAGGAAVGSKIADLAIPAHPEPIDPRMPMGERLAITPKSRWGPPPETPASAEPAASTIVSPDTGRPRVGNEGTAARWTNERAYELASQGNREAIMTLTRRGIELPPNTRYIAGDPTYAAGAYNPRDVTRFTPEGQPIRQAGAPAPQTQMIPGTRLAAPRGVDLNAPEPPAEPPASPANAPQSVEEASAATAPPARSKLRQSTRTLQESYASDEPTGGMDRFASKLIQDMRRDTGNPRWPEPPLNASERVTLAPPKSTPKPVTTLEGAVRSGRAPIAPPAPHIITAMQEAGLPLDAWRGSNSVMTTFNDPVSNSPITFLGDEPVTADAIKAKLVKARAGFKF